jgi:hypothetical protein
LVVDAVRAEPVSPARLPVFGPKQGIFVEFGRKTGQSRRGMPGSGQISSYNQRLGRANNHFPVLWQ